MGFCQAWPETQEAAVLCARPCSHEFHCPFIYNLRSIGKNHWLRNVIGKCWKEALFGLCDRQGRVLIMGSLDLVVHRCC